MGNAFDKLTPKRYNILLFWAVSTYIGILGAIVLVTILKLYKQSRVRNEGESKMTIWIIWHSYFDFFFFGKRFWLPAWMTLWIYSSSKTKYDSRAIQNVVKFAIFEKQIFVQSKKDMSIIDKGFFFWPLIYFSEKYWTDWINKRERLLVWQ